MAPRDWLLLLIAACSCRGGLDPVRIQKGTFLIAKEMGLPAREVYEFEAYNYGPMSRGVYRDVGRLVSEGLVERVPVPGYDWHRVELFGPPPRDLRALSRIRAPIGLQAATATQTRGSRMTLV